LIWLTNVRYDAVFDISSVGFVDVKGVSELTEFAVVLAVESV